MMSKEASQTRNRVSSSRKGFLGLLRGEHKRFLKAEHKRFLWATIAVGLLSLPATVFILNTVCSRLQSVSQVSAITERVEFEVTQPRLAALPVRRMRIATSDPALDGKCINGLILPVLKANVVYGRIGYGPLSIRIVPPDASLQGAIAGEFEPDSGGKSLPLKGSTYMETDESCAEGPGKKEPASNPPSSNALPIWGKARVGSEFKGMSGPDPDPTLLLSGQITVSARTVAVLSGFLGFRATIYPVTVLDLPVASRLEAYNPPPKSPPAGDQQENDETEIVANWWGTAYVDSEKPALSVELATDTAQLALYRPNLSEPDVIEVSSLNQIFDDPNLIMVYKATGVVMILVALCKWVFIEAIEDNSHTDEGAPATHAKEAHSK